MAEFATDQKTCQSNPGVCVCVCVCVCVRVRVCVYVWGGEIHVCNQAIFLECVHVYILHTLILSDIGLR